MDKVRINDVDVAVEVRGKGDPVLLIHGAFFADAHRLLADRLGEYRTIRYHRRGYGESGGSPSDIATHASDAQQLLEQIGVSSAHVVGHSAGGSIALQLAAQAPEVVASLSLLEPGITTQIPSGEIVAEATMPIFKPVGEGDLKTATDLFLRFVMGPEYPALLRKNISDDALDQGLKDAEDAFHGDVASLAGWQFGREQAAVITCPVMLVLGTESQATCLDALRAMGSEVPEIDLFGEMVDLLKSWMPQAEVVKLEGLNHALQIQDPDPIGYAIANFLAKHRLTVSA